MKVREAYERALSLINERNSSGEYHSDIVDYEKNVPDLINSIITLLWLDECVINKVNVRDISWDFEKIQELDDEIPLHPSLASGVLPYALASFLILEEDSSRANYFYRLYQNAREDVLRAFSSAQHTSIKNVY